MSEALNSDGEKIVGWRVGAIRFPPHLYFLVSAIFHYLGPAFAVLLFAHVSVLGVAWLRIASAAVVFTVWRRPWRTFVTLPAGREILSCWGDSKILEDASVNGRYTLMCTASSGAQRQMEVVTSGEP